MPKTQNTGFATLESLQHTDAGYKVSSHLGPIEVAQSIDLEAWPALDSVTGYLDLETVDIDATNFNFNVDAFNLFDTPEKDQLVISTSQGDLYTAFQPLSWTNHLAKTQDSAYYWSTGIPRQASSALRAFNHRPAAHNSTRRIANLILHTLKSYPLMLLHPNSLPPFIHPHLLSDDLENEAMEPLKNCITLVQMLNGRNRNTGHKLFWKNVRMECERLMSDYSTLSRWELVAAMQALSIYILVRLDEGETDHNNLDSLLVRTTIVIAKQFNNNFGGSDDGTSTRSEATADSRKARWRSWILEESARRLCVVYQVVNMLVYFEPAAMCDTHDKDLLLAPLPARKQLWEAIDEHAWNAEYETELGVEQTAFGLASNGDLVRMHDGRLFCYEASSYQSPVAVPINLSPTKGTASWEEWCAGMDGFGSLIMLAASLVA